MISNQKCDFCAIASICTARAKLKPFSEEARTDLGVELTFEKCDNFVTEEENGEEADLSEDFSENA